MKHSVLILLVLIMHFTSVVVYADIKEDYEQANKVYMAAGACMAAYSDRYGAIVNHYLEEDGWNIDHFNQIDGNINIRFLLAKKYLSDGQQLFILAIVGTENLSDIKIDLKVDKVYFSGNCSEEFEANVAKVGIPNTEPKVHRGFNEFVKAGLTTPTLDANGHSKFLTELLLADKNTKLYLVGHSLGGAAATLAGSRLISMGVNPEQIEIITFGAPAVGNAAYAAKFEPVLNLTRVVISGDPVTGILQTLVGGYKQFGRKIEWDMPANTYQPHNMNEYADLAIKNYYDKRQQALQAGVLHTLLSQAGGGTKYYIAPLKNNLSENLNSEYWYMQQVLWDEYQKILPGYVQAGDPDIDKACKQAVTLGCQWLVVPEVSSHRLKQERNNYYITLNQTIYDVATGSIVMLASFSTGTYNATPLEAVIHDFRGINARILQQQHLSVDLQN